MPASVRSHKELKNSYFFCRPHSISSMCVCCWVSGLYTDSYRGDLSVWVARIRWFLSIRKCYSTNWNGTKVWDFRLFVTSWLFYFDWYFELSVILPVCIIRCRYAGIVQGITNTIGAIPGFVAPSIITSMTPNVSTSYVLNWHLQL